MPGYANIEQAASHSQQFLRALIIDSLANLDTTACSLKLSLPNLSCSIRSWRQKNQVPSIPPPRRSGLHDS